MHTTRVQLVREITRVEKLRERYEAVRDLPHIDVEPVLKLLDDSLHKAAEAVEGSDPAAQLAALRELLAHPDTKNKSSTRKKTESRWR